MALANYLTQTYQQQGTQAGQQAQQQANVYNPQQQALQGGLGGFYNQLLQGNIPSQFTNPQAPMQAYTANFQNTLMPQYAAQYGAGSPAGLSAEAQGMQQLQGQLYNTGVGNFMTALGGAGNYAFNPIGGTGTQANTAQTGLAGTNTTGINPLVLALLGGTSGLGSSLGNLLSGT